VQSDPESATPASALAPRSGAPLAEHDADALTLTGGAGLFDHSARDAIGSGLGMVAGASAIVVTVIIGAALFILNPSFANNTASGTTNQLGAPPAAAGAGLEPGSPAAEGAMIIASKPCVGCHTIPGVPGANGQVGPNLAGVASRTKIAGGAVPNNGPDDLKKWISNPPALKPGTIMPVVPLTDDELTKIVAFLETLK
jgi:cytochrome c1